MQLSGGGKFLSAKTCQTGDVLTFKNAGEYRDSKFMNPDKKMDGSPHPLAGKPKRDLVFAVSVNGEDMIFTCNNTNQAILKDAYGTDTDKWVGRKCGITIVKVNVGGSLKDSVMLTPTKGTAVEAKKEDSWDN
jgi:hypothetical protein